MNLFNIMNIQYNLDKICRICMCEANNMKKIFGPVENISKILMFCSSINVNENDELPKQICVQCVNQANNASNFKQLCEQSDSVLRTYIKFKHSFPDNLKQEKVIYEVHDLFQSNIQDNANTLANKLFDETSLEQQMVIYEKQVFACDLCCEGFLHATSLEKHKELHSKNDTYACKVCNCFFLNQETLLVHKNTHHKNIMTQDILSEISDDVKPLLNAIKEEKHDNSVDSFSPENGKRRRGRPKQSQGQKVSHQCTICMEFFDKKLQLKRHTMSAHRDKLVTVELHQCSECEKTFSKVELLKRHMKQHSVQNYSCDDCPKTFNKLEKLTEHKKRHTGERSHLCSKCGKGYYKQPHLDKHMLSHLKDHLEKPVYQCTYCGKKLNHSNHLQVHMRTHRDRYGQPLLPQPPNPNKKVILCSVCGKSCSSRSNLAVHMRRHTGQMTNFCKICGKGYPRTTDLTLHMRKHTGEKPFVCSVCNRGFARSDKLAIHMRTHTGEKPYACMVCGRAFAQSNDLASHKRRNMCGQSLAANQNLIIQSSANTPGQTGSQTSQARAADLVSEVVQGVPELALHPRTIELAQGNVHSRIEYTDYTTATLLQNFSNGHFMR